MPSCLPKQNCSTRWHVLYSLMKLPGRMHVGSPVRTELWKLTGSREKRSLTVFLLRMHVKMLVHKQDFPRHGLARAPLGLSWPVTTHTLSPASQHFMEDVRWSSEEDWGRWSAPASGASKDGLHTLGGRCNCRVVRNQIHRKFNLGLTNTVHGNRVQALSSRWER